MVDALLYTIQFDLLFDVKTYIHIGVFLYNYPLEYERRIALKALHFMLLKGNMHCLSQNRVLRCCLDVNEATIIFTWLHKGVGRGHFFVEIIIKNILDAHYLWPTIYKDTLHFCKSCDEC
jgi:hypothetical protein